LKPVCLNKKSTCTIEHRLKEKALNFKTGFEKDNTKSKLIISDKRIFNSLSFSGRKLSDCSMNTKLSKWKIILNWWSFYSQSLIGIEKKDRNKCINYNVFFWKIKKPFCVKFMDLIEQFDKKCLFNLRVIDHYHNKKFIFICSSCS